MTLDPPSKGSNLSDIGDFHGLCVGFVVFWVGSPHMGGGALFAAKPGYAQPLGALGLNYSVVLSAWKYHAPSVASESGDVTRPFGD